MNVSIPHHAHTRYDLRRWFGDNHCAGLKMGTILAPEDSVSTVEQELNQLTLDHLTAHELQQLVDKCLCMAQNGVSIQMLHELPQHRHFIVNFANYENEDFITQRLDPGYVVIAVNEISATRGLPLEKAEREMQRRPPDVPGRVPSAIELILADLVRRSMFGLRYSGSNGLMYWTNDISASQEQIAVEPRPEGVYLRRVRKKYGNSHMMLRPAY